MVINVRSAEKAIGNVDYELSKKQHSARNFSRSLYVVKDVKKGERISMDNIRSIRPGFGMHPKFLPQIIGKVFKEDIGFGTALKKNHFE
jgi:pseudaminic acid synthase